MSERKMVKGAVVNGYLKFIKKKWGLEGLQEAVKYAGIEDSPKDGEWVPVEWSTNILRWIGENKGMKYVSDAGKYATTNLGIFTYIIASLMSPERFIKRARDTYRTLFNYGEFVVVETERGAIVTIREGRYPEPSCVAWEGALKGVMEITRTKGTVKAIEPDRPEDCKFEMVWKK